MFGFSIFFPHIFNVCDLQVALCKLNHAAEKLSDIHTIKKAVGGKMNVIFSLFLEIRGKKELIKSFPSTRKLLEYFWCKKVVKVVQL